MLMDPIQLKRRQQRVLWLLGLPGVVAVGLQVLPGLLQSLLAGRTQPLPLPLEGLLALQVGQLLLLLTAAVWIGGRLAPSLGLQSPLTAALARGESPWPALRQAALPSLLGGLLVGALLLAAPLATPAELAQLQGTVPMPLLSRLLYGGVTEELLLRWGLMSLVLWLIWRCTPKRRATPAPAAVLAAIVLSALAFGAAHLPAVATLIAASPSPAVVAYVVAFNGLGGVVFGLLFWRKGLEAAMGAHMLAHAFVVAFA